MTSGAFVHTCATVNSEGVAKLYRNGRFLATCEHGATPLSKIYETLIVGDSPWGNDVNIHGQIDDLRFYNRDISADEVWGNSCCNTLRNVPHNVSTGSEAHMWLADGS